MTRRTKQGTLGVYTRTLSTMTAVLQEVRDAPDSDGVLADLANRIEAEREWVQSLLALGEEPSRPPAWLRRTPNVLQASG
jgi:hypothetical protein